MKQINKTLAACFVLLFIFSFAITNLNAQKKNDELTQKLKREGAVWIPGNSNGTYKNPIIYADYSDPDAIRVGDDYYMTASSFSHFPGLPILHSKDLVNWKLIGHAALQYPAKEFDKPQHGMGIWAPSIRYHNNEFYIYFGDPDRGVFMTKAKNPAGPWEPLRLIRKVTGWIDTCPFWDDDGNAYIVHAWANSRVGVKSILAVNKMNKEGTQILDDGVVVFVGHFNHPTMEGPKFYKRNGYYYIFAPAGGVKPGWQVVLRSKNIFGPYEDKIVLEQGSTNINGPHQGAWIDMQTGEDWFLHFQDRYAYGRIIHMQPIKWDDDPNSKNFGWPMMGIDYDKNGIGEPVTEFKKPSVGKTFLIEVPATNDEFDSDKIALQWQWQANINDQWVSLKERNGWLRFFIQTWNEEYKNLFDVSSLMMQKFPAEKFTTTTKLELNSNQPGDKAGLIIFGLDYSYIGIEKTSYGYKIAQYECLDAEHGKAEKQIDSFTVSKPAVYLRVEVKPENEKEIIPKVLCSFSYSIDGKSFHPIGKQFIAKEGKWVGAKVGLFAISSQPQTKNTFCDFDWMRFE